MTVDNETVTYFSSFRTKDIIIWLTMLNILITITIFIAILYNAIYSIIGIIVLISLFIQGLIVYLVIRQPTQVNDA